MPVLTGSMLDLDGDTFIEAGWGSAGGVAESPPSGWGIDLLVGDSKVALQNPGTIGDTVASSVSSLSDCWISCSSNIELMLL